MIEFTNSPIFTTLLLILVGFFIVFVAVSIHALVISPIYHYLKAKPKLVWGDG